MSGPTDGLLPILPGASACTYGLLDGPAASRSRLGRLRITMPPLICILLLLAACGTTGIKPDEKLVSSVTSLPPVQVPLPVRCVKEMPPEPTQTICVPVQANDPNCDVRRRYFEMKAALAELDGYRIKANAALLACAGEGQKK